MRRSTRPRTRKSKCHRRDFYNIILEKLSSCPSGFLTRVSFSKLSTHRGSPEPKNARGDRGKKRGVLKKSHCQEKKSETSLEKGPVTGKADACISYWAHMRRRLSSHKTNSFFLVHVSSMASGFSILLVLFGEGPCNGKGLRMHILLGSYASQVEFT